VRSHIAVFLLAAAFFAPAAACNERSAEGDGAAAADSPAAGGSARRAEDSEKPLTTPLAALSEARKLQLQTALLGVNKALLNFHVLEGRYPADQTELESAPEVAGDVALLKAVVEGLSYELEKGSYTLVVTLPDGPPITMKGSDPSLRPESP
jgi:hypothetical protein